MNKKIITVALASAFSSASFADVSITGSMEQSYTNTEDGTTAVVSDGKLSFKAAHDLLNGMSVSTDFNISAKGENDGGNSLTVSGDFGKLDMGDTSSAIDAIDDFSDWGYVQTTGVSNPDHAIRWTLPSIVPGASVNISHAADTNPDGNSGGNSYAVKYGAGPVTVGYGALDNDDGSEASMYNAVAKFGGFAVGYEVLTKTTAADVDTDYTAIGASYALGNTEFLYESVVAESEGSESSNKTAFGVHYKIASQLLAFVETSDDSKAQNDRATSVGLEFKF
mgnify:CR=1 FL=1